MPNDGGHLLFTRFGKDDLLKRQPDAAKFLRRFVGAEEFLNGTERWCLWLHGENVGEFRPMRAVMDCVQAVAIHRQNSNRDTTKKLAQSAAYFGEIRQPDRPDLTGLLQIRIGTAGNLAFCADRAPKSETV